MPKRHDPQANADQILGTLLIELQPEPLVDACRLLAELRFPIQDRDALLHLLTGLDSAAEALHNAGVEELKTTFVPIDFPLPTLQGAIEKYLSRVVSLETM